MTDVMIQIIRIDIAFHLGLRSFILRVERPPLFDALQGLVVQ